MCPATCSSDTGLDQTSYSVDFTQGASDDWNVTYGTVTYDSTYGATYTISESGDAPTMQTNWYLFFGVVSVVMRAAPGTGIVSCAILESDDLDEIDWEWLGGTASQVETNYFGKGNTSTYDRETYVDMGSEDAQADFHNYTLVWTEASLQWLIDGAVVRTLAYADADAGENYPQTPMRVKLGIWAGGDSSNSEGTIEWAGGETDYDDGPFTAYVKSVEVTNYNPASSYTYSDQSGSYESITLNDDDDGETSDSSSTTTTSSTQAEGASSSAAQATATGLAPSGGPGSGSGSGAIVSTNATSHTAGSSSNSTASSSSSSSLGSSNSTTTSSSSSSSSTSTSSSIATAGAATWAPSLTAALGMLVLAVMMV